jgi:hypothetical protein
MSKMSFNATTSTRFLGNAQISTMDTVLTAAAPSIGQACFNLAGVNYAEFYVTNNDTNKALLYIFDNVEVTSTIEELGPGMTITISSSFGFSEPYSYNYSAYASTPGKTNSSTTNSSGSLAFCVIL